MLADAEVNLGLAGGLVLLALIVFVWWFGRDRRYRRIRFGIFLERERFHEKEKDDERDRNT